MNAFAPHLDAPTLAKYRITYLRTWLLSFAIIGIEISGAVVSGSFALRADVWHVAGDILVASAPLIITYARGGKHGNLAVLLPAGGITVATILLAIGCMLLVEARESLSTTTAQHEVHGWLLSGFALGSASVNLWQHRLLSQVEAAHRDIAHVGFHFHVLMDLLKNAALPLLGALIGLKLIPDRADIWAAAGIGAWIAIRGLMLLAGSVLALTGGRQPA